MGFWIALSGSWPDLQIFLTSALVVIVNLSVWINIGKKFNAVFF
jgi:hypothetical protein